MPAGVLSLVSNATASGMSWISIKGTSHSIKLWVCGGNAHCMTVFVMAIGSSSC